MVSAALIAAPWDLASSLYLSELRDEKVPTVFSCVEVTRQVMVEPAQAEFFSNVASGFKVSVEDTASPFRSREIFW